MTDQATATLHCQLHHDGGHDHDHDHDHDHHRRLSSDGGVHEYLDEFDIDSDSDDFCKWSSSISNKCSSSFYPLLHYVHLPPWLRDNKHIFTGYRINLGWKRSCDSACHMHNETINVWTHLVAFLVMTFLLVLTLTTTSPHGSDRLTFGVVVHQHSNNIQHYATPQLCSADLVRRLFWCGIHDEEEISTWNSQHEESSICSPANSFFSNLHPDCLLATLAAPSSSSASLPSPSLEQFELLYERVRATVPTLEKVSAALLQKAYQLSDLVHTAGPSWPHIERTKNELISYVERVEVRLATLKETLSEVSAGSSQFITDAQTRLLKQVSEFSPLRQLKLPHADLLAYSTLLLTDFYHSLYSNTPNAASHTSTTPSSSPSSPSPSLASSSPSSPSSSSSSSWPDGIRVTIIPLPKAISELASSFFVAHDDDKDSLRSDEQFSNTNNSRELIDGEANNNTVVSPSLSAATSKIASFVASSSSMLISSVPVKMLRSFIRNLNADTGLHSYLSRWPLAAFIITAMCCLGFSAFFHLFQSVSRSTCNTLQCLDYAGICLLITGSNIPIIYYGFYCVPAVRYLYLIIASALGLFGFVVSVLPRFRPVKYREMKTLVFLMMGLFGIVPLSHLTIHFGQLLFIFWYMLAMGLTYIMGAVIYVFRIPECFWPGRFDYWFHSHQLWHVSIFVAVLTHYFGVVKFYEWRMQQVCV